MCTIVVFSGVHPGAELIVAANRDEFYERPTELPTVLDAATGVVGARDAEGGGTWIGATPNGFFVGLTNQRTWHAADKSLASRGLVALGALSRGHTAGVRALLGDLDPRQYNPFNLIYGDHWGVEVAYIRPEGVERKVLPAGIHVLTNDRMGSLDFPKAARAQELARGLGKLSEPADWPRVKSLLADHALPDLSALPKPPADSLFTAEIVHALQALCIHTPQYGTRSSTFIASSAGRVLDYRYADGPPCETELASYAALFSHS